jgi:hypothetical protein
MCARKGGWIDFVDSQSVFMMKLERNEDNDIDATSSRENGRRKLSGNPIHKPYRE